MNNYFQQQADIIQKSILDGLKLGIANGNSETYKDPNRIQDVKNIIEKLCQTENELEQGKNLINTFDCQSFTDFDKEYKLASDAASRALPSPKDSNRYTTFVKNLEDLQYVNNTTQSEMQGNLSVVDGVGFTEESFTIPTDPITKNQIKDPVRNRLCNHVYDKSSIMESISMNSRIRCPYVGCGNKQQIKQQDLIEDRDMKRRIMRGVRELMMDLDEEED